MGQIRLVDNSKNPSNIDIVSNLCYTQFVIHIFMNSSKYSILFLFIGAITLNDLRLS